MAITIKPLQREHAGQVARLHIMGIHTGFISSLGEKFVTALYEAIADSPKSFGCVAIENNKVLGFAAFTENLNALYKSIIFKAGFRFAFILAGKLFSWHRIKRIFETLFYPGRIKTLDLPTAEFLSISINLEARGKGIAQQLLSYGLNQCQERGLDSVKLLVGADNEPAIKLYLKCGFNLVGDIENHGIKSNIYVKIFNQTLEN